MTSMFNGHRLIFITISIIVSISYFSAVVSARRMVFKTLDCLDHNNDVCSDLACSINGKKKKSMSLGCTMQHKTNEMRWHVKVSYVNPQIKPYVMEGTGDYCDIVNGRIESGGIKMAMPLIKTFLPQFAKECPYSGRLEVADFDPNEIMSMFPPMAPPGDYTWEAEIINDRNETIIHPKISFSVKK